MIKNYFKIAWRNLYKYKIFSIINILGLAIGVAAFWMITLYVTDEVSYDRYNVKADRIFRVACLGLFGLVTFTAEQRVKEIGIRKILGAGVNDIIKLLSGELMQLVLLSTVIAAPIAWWAMNQWLQGFAYRINVKWWVLLSAGSVAMLIAFTTVSIQAIRSAISNPVKSLRNE